MNIVLFLNKDLESNLAYNLLKEELSKHCYKIYYSEGVGDPNKKPEDLNELEYYEKQFFYEKLEPWLKEKEPNHTFDFFNKKIKNVSFEKCTSIKNSIFLKSLKAFEPDLFISIRFGKIFKGDILNIPKKGILNLHSAILPDYKGILGTLHALKDSQKEIGCTLHYISDNTIDTGEIIDVAKLQTKPSKSLLWHVVNLYPLGCKMIVDSLRKLETKDRLFCEKQNTEEGNYFSVPTVSDFEELKKMGFETFSKKDYVEILKEWVCPNISEEEIRKKLNNE